MKLPDLPTTPVRIDHEQLLSFVEGTEYVVEKGNALSPLSGLCRTADLTLAQLEGRKDAPIWKVESLAVLLGCLPSALIVTHPKEETMKTNGNNVVMHCQYCDMEVHGGQGKAAHERHCKKNPAVLAKKLGGYQPKSDVLDPKNQPKGKTATRDHVAEGAIEADEFNVDAPVEERECEDETCSHGVPKDDCHVQPCDECAPAKPKQLSVTVEVSGLTAVKLMLREQESLIELLAERVLELEAYRKPRIFSAGPQRPYELSVESVREWAASELKDRKRQQFRERLYAAIADIEQFIFDEQDDGGEAA